MHCSFAKVSREGFLTDSGDGSLILPVAGPWDLEANL
jgi:hypothetical protein